MCSQLGPGRSWDPEITGEWCPMDQKRLYLFHSVLQPFSKLRVHVSACALWLLHGVALARL
jgi:hypothetical protein